jgi:hypothetical protein
VQVSGFYVKSVCSFCFCLWASCIKKKGELSRPFFEIKIISNTGSHFLAFYEQMAQSSSTL